MTVSLVTLGVRVDLQVPTDDDFALEALIRHAWSRCLHVGNDPAQTTLSVGARGGAQGIEDGAAASLLDDLAMRINREVTRARAGELFMLHAATMADPTSGAAIALAAPSGMGKTTVCRMLGQALGYVSDEVCGIEADGTVVPYPKPLSVIEPASSARKASLSPDTLGLLPAPLRSRLAAVLILERRTDGPLIPIFEPVRLLESIAILGPNSFQMAALRRPLHVAAEHLTRVGGVRRVFYREASDLLPMVQRLLAGAEPSCL